MDSARLRACRYQLVEVLVCLLAAALCADLAEVPPSKPVVLPTLPGGRHCVFPFWWRGRWYHTCVRYSVKGETWCSLSANFTRDENWKRCDSHDEKRFQCSIPFVYAGVKSYTCLPMSMGGPSGSQGAASTFWCGLAPSVAGVGWLSADWAFCETPNATTADYLKALGEYRDLRAARQAALARIGSPANAAVKTEAAALVAAAAAAAAAAVAATAQQQAALVAGSPHLDGGGSSSGGGGGGWGVGLVSTLVVACCLLALAVGLIGCTLHRRYFRGRYKRIDPLLASDAVEKSSYGGVEAYHD